MHSSNPRPPDDAGEVEVLEVVDVGDQDRIVDVGDQDEIVDVVDQQGIVDVGM